MKSIFYRIFTITVALLAGLAVTVLLAFLAVPDVFCIASLLHAPRKVACVLALLATLSAFSAFIGCSSKHDPEPAKPAEIRWRGPATGYQDTTKSGEQSSLKP
jgi:hypothetical protein